MSDEFTLDEVLELVGKVVTVRYGQEEILHTDDGRRIPFLEGEHSIKGFRFHDDGYEIDVPEKPFEEGQVYYFSKLEFNKVFRLPQQ